MDMALLPSVNLHPIEEIEREWTLEVPVHQSVGTPSAKLFLPSLAKR